MIEIAIGVIALIVLIFFKIFYRAGKFPYYKNRYFISNAERKVFLLLQEIVGEKYYIFPQVSIISLLKVDKNEKDFWIYFNKIRQKSVDFVLADKGSFDPVLAIELNDFTHDRYDRRERDEFVTKAFSDAGMKFVVLEGKSYTEAELAQVLNPFLS
jgi:hypothetical protein